jgi:hypothetical protein
MLEQVTSPFRLLALAAAAMGLLRRLMPAVTCTRCGSGAWTLMGDMKQCSRCGRLFV